MGKAHQNQKKAAQPKSETYAQATRKMYTINRKQTPPIQSSSQNPYGPMEFSYGGQPPIPKFEILQSFQSKTIRSILNAPWYINNHRIHEDLQMNTVLSEIKKWNTKYLRKLGN
jgi:hypothetical protein